MSATDGSRLPVELVRKILHIAASNPCTDNIATSGEYEKALFDGKLCKPVTIREINSFLARASLVCKTWQHSVADLERTIFIGTRREAELYWRSIREGAVYKVKSLSFGLSLKEEVGRTDLTHLASKVLLPILLHAVNDGSLLALSIPSGTIYETILEAWRPGVSPGICKVVPTLHLCGRPTDRDGLLIRNALKYLEVDLNIRNLVLSNISIDRLQDTRAGIKCESLSWYFDLHHLERVNYYKLFPALNTLHLVGLVSSCLCFFLPRSDVDLPDVNMETRAELGLPAQFSLDPRIYLISTLTSLSIVCNVSGLGFCRFVQPVSLPGRHMLKLERLEIELRGCRPCLTHLLDLCASFEDSAFCPRLEYLPRITFSPTVHRDTGNHAFEISATEMEKLRVGLDGLANRGISISRQDMKGTLWEYAA